MKKLRTLALALAVLAVLTSPAGVQVDSHNDTAEALAVPVALTEPAAPAQGWSVAIEQNAMLTKCGNTNNIPVAGASDCTTAKAAAWNLLTTLLQTPNCMNPGCPPGYIISQGVSTCNPDPYTRPNGSPAMRWQVSWTWTCAPPPCSNYKLDLSTGQGGPNDSLWKVNGNPAYITPPYVGWIAPLAPAKWIQPVASPTPSPNVPPGIYHYTVTFKVPPCPAGKVQLDLKLAADNSAKVLLDGVPKPTSPCLTTCFKAPQAPVSLSIPAISAGAHTLQIDVTNTSGPSGLFVSALVTRKCP